MAWKALTNIQELPSDEPFLVRSPDGQFGIAKARYSTTRMEMVVSHLVMNDKHGDGLENFAGSAERQIENCGWNWCAFPTFHQEENTQSS